MFEVKARLEHLLSQLESEIDILQVEKRIRGRVKRQMEKSQREYYLNEQVKAIRRSSAKRGRRRSRGAGKAHQGRAHVQGSAQEGRSRTQEAAPHVAHVGGGDGGAQLRRDARQPPLEEAQQDLARHRAAEKILDTDHYGLEKVKERIVEYLAVQSRVDKVKRRSCAGGRARGGKDILGQSVARATNRKFVRMSLGACATRPRSRPPGTIWLHARQDLQNMSKVGVRNPLFLLDEVDKLGMDFRGDPSSRSSKCSIRSRITPSTDHYVESNTTLGSDVRATANTLNIPPACSTGWK